MNIIYISAMFDDNIIKLLYKADNSPNYAANKYHQLFCKGLAENGVSVNAYSTLPISGRNCRKKFVKIEPETNGTFLKEYISVINIKGIKHILLFMKSFLKVIISKREKIILYDPLVMPASFGAVLAAKIKGYKAVGIITDLPVHMHKKTTGIKSGINNKLVDMADAYILLTKEMNDVINKKKKPSIVLEGHVDYEMHKRYHLPFDANKKKVIYAGGLQKKYGIEKLVNAFLNCHKENEELHIYGDGEFAKELTIICKNNHCVKYHGSRPNSEVVEAELHAMLLVNPRSGENDFTKYSFPSKNLEYMASGTPVLMAKLPGIPDEYDSYVYYFDDRDDTGLEDTLRYLLDKEKNELESFGYEARKFVLEEKNNIKQTKRVVEFLTIIGANRIENKNTN